MTPYRRAVAVVVIGCILLLIGLALTHPALVLAAIGAGLIFLGLTAIEV